MKTISFALFLSFAIVQSALVLGQEDAFVSVCDRSPEIRRVIIERVNKRCNEVTAEDFTFTSLHLNTRGISELKAGDFSGMSNLLTLDLSGNQLVELPPGLFSGLENLQTLILNNNILLEINEEAFRGLNALTLLTLTSNEITQINRNDFLHIPNLRELNLVHNRLASLEAEDFELVELEALILHGNLNLQIESGLATHLAQLKGLSIDWLLFPQFRELQNLDFLALSDVEVTRLDPELFIASSDTLRSLTISSTTLEEIPDNYFVRYPQIRRVDVSRTPLTRTSPAAFKGVAFVRLPSDFGVEEGEVEWRP